MTTTSASFVIQCWHEQPTGIRLVRVVRVETEQTIPLATNSFLLRFTCSADGSIERCYMRHIASGRQAYVQGGPGLSAFVRECLLEQISDSAAGA